MITKLVGKTCVACKGGEPTATADEIKKYSAEVGPEWQVIYVDASQPSGDGAKIRRDFKFKDFKEAMKFINKVAELAEEQGHHPNIYVYYNKVTLELWTHKIFGLHQNDFIMAAKINETFKKLRN